MFQKDRIVRLAVALTIAGAVASQIPSNSGTAIARDGYGGRGSSGGRDAIRIAVAGLVAYGIYATATAPAAAAGAAAAAGTAGSAAVVPIVPVTSDKTIYETVSQSDDMKQFGNAVDQAGLKDQLSQTGPYTAFVPNNAAFASMDAAKLADLQKPENKAQLAALVNYHVINGKYTIDQLKQEATAAGAAGKKYATLGGGTVTITYDQTNNILAINGATIVQSDIPASNGVIHQIGQILTPPAATASVTPPAATPPVATVTPTATTSPVAATPTPAATPPAATTPSDAITAPDATPPAETPTAATQ